METYKIKIKIAGAFAFGSTVSFFMYLLCLIFNV
jgi:hypothetical protein